MRCSDLVMLRWKHTFELVAPVQEPPRSPVKPAVVPLLSSTGTLFDELNSGLGNEDSSDDGGLGSMLLGQSMSPKKVTLSPQQRTAAMSEVLRRMNSTRPLFDGGSSKAGQLKQQAAPITKPTFPAPPAPPLPLPVTMHEPVLKPAKESKIKRLRVGKLERVRETMLQVLLQLQLASFTSQASKRKAAGEKATSAAVAGAHDPMLGNVLVRVRGLLSLGLLR